MKCFALRWLRWSALGGFAVCAAITSGCGDEDGAPGASARGTQLVGTQWDLDVSALGVSDAGSVSSWIAFERDRVSGNDGCNTFSGSYQADGSELTFGPLAVTRMACGSPADEVSREVTAAIARVRSYELAGDALRMKDADGETALTYAAAADGIEGSWTVISVLYDGAIRSAVADAEPDGGFLGRRHDQRQHGLQRLPRPLHPPGQEPRNRHAHRDREGVPDDGRLRAGGGLSGRARIRGADRAGRPAAHAAERQGAEGRHAHAQVARVTPGAAALFDRPEMAGRPSRF